MNIQSRNHHRHIHYLDNRIQKGLLIALVSMEIMLVVIAMWLLHGTLSDAIEQQMYQVHFTSHRSIFSILFTECVKILGVFLLVNLAALLLAERIWAYWVNGILRNLMTLTEAALHLDFSEKSHISCNHPVLMQAMAWRYAEFFRIEGVRQDIHTLPSALAASAKEREDTAASLKKIIAALPAD